VIIESPVITVLTFQSYDAGTASWVTWTGDLNGVGATRGGKPSGVTATVDVGILSATLVNAGDPITDSRLAPNVEVRLLSALSSEPVFTGRIIDLDVDYVLDKKTGVLTSYTTLVAGDAVVAHANTTRYGAVTAGGAGFESWANRVIRLATSSVTDINPPADDAPIVRYAI
jgi:hypothetical protein